MQPQLIYTSAHTSNFTQVSNALLDSVIPAKPQKVLLYLLSKPKNWQLRFTDLKHRLGLSAYAVRQALRWLQSAGFIYYERLKSGHTTWFIYDKPQVTQSSAPVITDTITSTTPDLKPHVEIPHVENRTVLVTLRQTEIQEQQPPLPTSPPIISEVSKPVVVVVSESLVKNVTEEAPATTDTLIFPEKLTQEQKKQAKHVIKKCKQELKQDVLYALAYAMVQGKVKNPVAYLQVLVKSANEGIFSPVSAKKSPTLEERIASEKRRQEEAQNRYKVDNNKFFQMLKDTYGFKSS